MFWNEFSDLAGVPSSSKIEDIDNELLKPTNLFETLNNSTWYSEHLEGAITDNDYPTNPSKNERHVFTRGNFVVGIKNQCNRTLATTLHISSQGKSSADQSTTLNQQLLGQPTKLEISQWLYPRQFTFNNTSSGMIEESNSTNVQTIYINLTYNQFLIPNHRIAWLGYDSASNMTLSDSNNIGGHYQFTTPASFIPNNGTGSALEQIGALSIGWTRTDVDLNNRIHSDKAAVIPVVKSLQLDYRSKVGGVVKGPGHTGGDLVKLPPNSSLIMEFTYPFYLRYPQLGVLPFELTLNIKFQQELKKARRVVNNPY